MTFCENVWMLLQRWSMLTHFECWVVQPSKCSGPFKITHSSDTLPQSDVVCSSEKKCHVYTLKASNLLKRCWWRSAAILWWSMKKKLYLTEILLLLWCDIRTKIQIWIYLTQNWDHHFVPWFLRNLFSSFQYILCIDCYLHEDTTNGMTITEMGLSYTYTLWSQIQKYNQHLCLQSFIDNPRCCFHIWPQ